jgi:hypothetical protein
MSETLINLWRAHVQEVAHDPNTLRPDTSKGHAWCPVKGCLWNAQDPERLAGQSPDNQTIKYVGHKEFERDQTNWLRKGYRVANVDEVKHPAGVARIATLGVGALVVKPKSHFYVTYIKG